MKKPIILLLIGLLNLSINQLYASTDFSYTNRKIPISTIFNDCFSKLMKENKVFDKNGKIRNKFLMEELQKVIKKYHYLKDHEPEKYDFRESELEELGKNAAWKLGGIEILKLNVKEYPDSAKAYKALADAYKANNQYELAEKNYKKALQLEIRPIKKEIEELQILKKIQSKMINVGNVDLYFRYTPGKLPAIVIEAGSGENSSNWYEIQNQLSMNLPNAIVTYDRNGYGKSGYYNCPYDIEEEVGYLRTGLEKLGVADDIILVGHSFGGLLVQYYAYKYKKSIKYLIYLDPSTIPFILNNKFKSFLRKLYNSSNSGLTPAVKREITGEFKNIPEKMKNIPTSDIPTIVISAEYEDQVFKEMKFSSFVREFAKKCNAQLIIAKGSGHNIQEDDPKLVISTIEKVCKKLRE